MYSLPINSFENTTSRSNFVCASIRGFLVRGLRSTGIFSFSVSLPVFYLSPFFDTKSPKTLIIETSLIHRDQTYLPLFFFLLLLFSSPLLHLFGAAAFNDFGQSNPVVHSEACGDHACSRQDYFDRFCSRSRVFRFRISEARIMPALVNYGGKVQI